MFKIEMYSTNSEPNKLNKQLEKIRDYEAECAYEEVDIENPDLIISSDTFPGGNYVYIPFYNRYYFIIDKVAQYNNLWRISLSEDYLMSSKSEIENLVAIIDRQQFLYNWYLTDDMLTAIDDNLTVIRAITPTASANLNTCYQIITLNGATPDSETNKQSSEGETE